MRQHGREMKVRVVTYSLEVPVNYIAGMEIEEALSDVG